jgi:hypothetical protein
MKINPKGNAMKQWAALIMIFSAAAWLPAAAGAELEGGAGMEYFSVQAYTRDHDGKHLLTLVQSTLAKAKVQVGWEGWYARVTGGIGDWQSGGEWTGSDGPIPMNEAGLATWVQTFAAEIGYDHRWGQAGLAYDDRDLKNDYVTTSGQLTHLAFRLRSYELFARLHLYQDSATQISLGGGYAPAARVELYHNEFTSVEGGYDYYQVNAAGQSPCWHGNVQLKYRDTANWGIDILYDAGWAQFNDPSNLSEISLRFGSLTGFFMLWF